jgi:hypothetical protein
MAPGPVTDSKGFMFDYTWEGTPPKSVPTSPALGVDITSGTLYVGNPKTGSWTGVGGGTAQSLSNAGNSIVLNTSGVAQTDLFGNIISSTQISGSNVIRVLTPQGAGLVLISNILSSAATLDDASGNSLQVGGGVNNFNLSNTSTSAGVINTSGSTLQVIGTPVKIVGPIILTTASSSAAAGQVSIGATTATSATAGANGDVPAQVLGYLNINVAGVAAKIPYYNA